MAIGRLNAIQFAHGSPRAPALARACLLVIVFLGGCASNPVTRINLEQLVPLQLADRVVTLSDVAVRVSTPDLLRVDEPMREFVQRYTGSTRNSRQKLFSLHQAVKGGGMLDMQYDPFADGSAAESFHRGSANCLSYAHLFVALAREAGLQARYQWLEMRPQWARLGERVAVRLHVNVLVDLPRNEQYMVDIDPLQSSQVSGTRVLGDNDGKALYHSNLAMDALADNDLEQAWLHAVRALQLAPEMTHLWVNLGAIYRQAGQQAEAERSYYIALQLDPGDNSAMNNLVVLYERQGREDEHSYWLSRVNRYRDANPYYHAWLGDSAAKLDDWTAALGHYQRALELAPSDNRLLYATGIIYFKLDDLDRAGTFVGRAIDHATLRGDILDYQLRLNEIRRQQLAGE